MLLLTTPGGAVVCLYDDLRNLSAVRYQRFCAKYLQYSVGSDVMSAEGHLGRMALFLNGKDYEGLRGEFNNLVLNLSLVRAEESGLALVLSCLVESIDGQACADVSDSGLHTTALTLLAAGITQGVLSETIDELKKKLKSS